VPVEPEALLLPELELLLGADPVGEVTLALPAGELAPAVGLAFTGPIWAVPVELVAVFPESASAGAAVPSTAAQTAAARPKAMRLISPLFLEFERVAGTHPAVELASSGVRR
jgi:hypothetical protein